MGETIQYNPEDEIVKEGPNKGNVAATEFVQGNVEDGSEHTVIAGVVRDAAERDQKAREKASTPILGSFLKHAISYTEQVSVPRDKDEFANYVGEKYSRDHLAKAIQKKLIESGVDEDEALSQAMKVVEEQEKLAEERKAEAKDEDEDL